MLEHVQQRALVHVIRSHIRDGEEQSRGCRGGWRQIVSSVQLRVKPQVLSSSVTVEQFNLGENIRLL